MPSQKQVSLYGMYENMRKALAGAVDTSKKMSSSIKDYDIANPAPIGGPQIQPETPPNITSYGFPGGKFNLKNLGFLTIDSNLRGNQPSRSTGLDMSYEGRHPGLDIAPGNNKLTVGPAIPAFTSGRVTGVRTGQKNAPGSKSHGNYVEITDKYGFKHRYSHLSDNPWVRVGQEVQQGTQLGLMGNTGDAVSTSGGTGVHLHYQVTDAGNQYVNPWMAVTYNG